MRLDLLLVELGHFESRAKARAAIEAGGVQVEGRRAAKASELVDPAAALTVRPAHPWVGRGALKLAHALELWPVEVDGKVVLDVGASTGGFTEVCLGRGARKVYAVDVGRGQLHASIVRDPRVVNLEATDARNLDRATIADAPEVVVCDASFIGLAKVLPRPLQLVADHADLVALVKPQFEVGPARVGKGGLVTDPDARAEAVAGARSFLERLGWTVREIAESPVTGGDGNVEFLLWASRE